MAVIRSVYHVHVRGKGPSLLGNAPRLQRRPDGCVTIREKSADRTGLPIIEMGANAANFDKPGIYVRAEVFDEMRPGETRCCARLGSITKPA